MADTDYNTKVYEAQGGAEEVVAAGGKISVRSGGVINIEAGGAFEIAGVDVTATAGGAGIAGVAAGYKLARGTATLDGSNPTPVTTGLAAVVAAVACIKSTAALGLDPTMVTVGYSGGTLNIYAWKVTASGDATLIASTNASVTVDWIAIGT